MNSWNTFFTDKEQLRKIDTCRIVYLITFILSFLLTEFGRFIYRPLIYENSINDYGVADSIGNSGGILVQIFFGLAIFNSSKKKGFRLIGFFVIGYIFYEIIQPYLPRGVFDWKDIYGTLIGAAIGSILFALIHMLIKQNRILYRF